MTDPRQIYRLADGRCVLILPLDAATAERLEFVGAILKRTGTSGPAPLYVPGDANSCDAMALVAEAALSRGLIHFSNLAAAMVGRRAERARARGAWAERVAPCEDCEEGRPEHEPEEEEP